MRRRFILRWDDDVTSKLDDIAPVAMTTKRQSNSVRNDLSSTAISLKRTRRLLERRYVKDRNECNRLAYRAACREANQSINDSRSKFNVSRFEAAKGNHRDL